MQLAKSIQQKMLSKLIDDCPQCAGHRKWLSENAKTCGYHGDRLPSICANDPECVKWREECARQGALLAECLEQCRLAAVPEGPGLSGNNCRPHETWLNENAGDCGYHGDRLPSICARDPVCRKWKLNS